MTRRNFTADPEAAQQKRADALTRLETAIEAVTTSDGFREWLRVASRFHRYSFGNQLMIATHRPDATRVAGFRAWSELGRYVRKGAKGIPIFVPHVYKAHGAAANSAGEAGEADTDEATGAAGSRVGFGIGYVFDVSDTDGEPLPDLGYVHTEGETAGELWQRIEAVAAALNVPIRCDERPSTAMGYFDPHKGEIWHRPELSLDGRASTVLHELAHVLDYRAHADAGEAFDYRNHRGDRETVAEAVAYVAADHFGLDNGTETFTYVASWARDVKVLKARMGEIQRLADALINALEANDVPTMGEAVA